MTRSRFLILLGVLVAFAPALHADSTADEADFRFHRGAHLYREGKIEEALGEFLASNRLVRNRNVLFNIARCFEDLHRYNEAFRFYVEKENADADAGVPPTGADRSQLEQALARLRPSLALLQIDSTPPGATVYLDRRDLGARGQTPVTLAGAVGSATAIIELAGYKPALRQVSLAVGKTATVSLSLERIYGTLAVEGSPAQFELRADGESGPPLLTGNGSTRLVPGRHLLHILALGFSPQQLLVDVQASSTAAVRFSLTRLAPPQGALVVRANVDGALVRVDGKEAGFTPAVIDNVAVGTHQIEVLADGREPVRRQAVVALNERSFIEVKLRYAEARVVAAERQLTRVHDAPASITVLSAEEIRGFGWVTLSEALQFVRGLYISSDRDYDTIGVRGFSTPGTYNNHVLVLSDGHVTNELSLGQGFVGRDFDSDLSDVERIEVVRGPGSVLYGSAAFFAVINVVHKQPALGAHASVNTFVGSQGENTGSATLGAAREGWSVQARGAGVDISGEPVFLEPGMSGAGANGADGERAGHLDLRARGGDFALAASYNDRLKDIPTAPFDTIFGAGGTNTRDRRGFAELSFDHAFESGLGVDGRVSYDAVRYRGNWNYQVGPGTDGSDQDWVTGEARLRLPTFLGNNVFVGSEMQDRYRVDIYSFTPGAPVFDNRPGNPQGLPDSERIVSVYGGDDLRLGSRLQLDAAIRLDDYLDSFGMVVNPRLALIAEPYAGGTTKLLYGTAFRAPGFYERYFKDSGYSQIQAVDLQPEHVMTGEIEHTHQLNDDTSLLVSGYWSRIENLIGAQPVAGGLIQFQNSAGLVHSAGVEAELRWQPQPGALLSIWYAYARVRGSSGSRLPNSPEHTGALRALIPVVPRLLSFSTAVAYGSPRQTVVDATDPVQLAGETLNWNVGLSGEYSPWRLRYGAYAEDLLDQRVNLPGGAEIPTQGHLVPQLGRTLRLQLGATF